MPCIRKYHNDYIRYYDFSQAYFIRKMLTKYGVIPFYSHKKSDSIYIIIRGINVDKLIRLSLFFNNHSFQLHTFSTKNVEKST